MEDIKLKSSHLKRFKVKSSLVCLLGIIKIKITGLQSKQTNYHYCGETKAQVSIADQSQRA